jgi:hypothetical protein
MSNLNFKSCFSKIVIVYIHFPATQSRGLNPEGFCYELLPLAKWVVGR